MTGQRLLASVVVAFLLAATGWLVLRPAASGAAPAPQATGTPFPTPAHTAVPSATPSATGSPTVRPTATPTRTPTPDPRLTTGRWLQSIGDCAGARREFADLLAAKPAAAEASEARYRMAQCYLRDEAPAEAAVVLEQLLASAPKADPYRGPANFLLGEALSQSGRWRDAEARYAAYLPLAPEIKAVTWQRIGAARKGAGNLIGATLAYSTALQASFDWTNTVAIRRALADLAAAQGDYAAAARQYDALRGTATKNAWAAEMYYLAGSALAQAGNQAEAQRRWQAAIDADMKTRFAHQAVVALLDANAPVDEYQRGVVDYYNGLYRLAVEAFDRLQASDPSGRQGAAWYYRGLSYLALGQTDQGLAELGNFIAAYPASPLWADAWLAKARAQDRAGRTADAIATYREFAGLRPDAPQAPKALWQAGNLLAAAGRTAEAADVFLTLGRRYPSADEGWRGYQWAGLIYFRQGDWRQAGQVWDEMSRAPLPSWTLPVAYYWLGRAQAAAGETAAALRSWSTAWNSDPGSYYGLRAAEWAGRYGSQGTVLPGATPSGQPARPGTAQQEAGELAAWLRGWAGEGTLALPAAVLADADWKRGQALMLLGLRSQALAAFERVQQRHGKNPWTQAALAIAFRDLGAHRLSLLSAESVASQWQGGTMRDAPVALQRLAYPMAYADLIREQAEKWDLDPRLLAAVIRQESRFEVAATSSAGAQGLMQVMPGTAQGIASRLGWRDFEAKQAYWPYINVALGANYIATWLNHFNGSVAAALAAYNGGPGNAAVWRAWAPDDDDLMVALININETRVYVQAVYAQYDMYKRLYPAGG